MSTQQLQELSEAQSIIYTRTNMRRAFSDFDDTDIAGIYKCDDFIHVLRKDGSAQDYPAEPIRQSFVEYTTRLKDFFAYLGPGYRGPSIWNNNAYIIYKGWNYVSQLSHTSPNAKLQARWLNKFNQIKDQDALIALLQGDQTDIGHLVAPDGLRTRDMEVHLDDGDIEQQSNEPVVHRPYCSCGSFQRQQQNLAGIQEEIPGYQASCIHVTWFNRYRQFLVRRAELRNDCRGQVAQQATAWAYAPPEMGQVNGKFMVLYTKHGSMAPIGAWRVYKPNEVFTQNDAWTLFDAMMDSGYVPFPAVALPQLNSAFKSNVNV